MRLGVKLGLLSASNVGMVFLFQWYVLVYFGAGTETDAFFAGMAIPQLVLVVITGSLMHVLVPLLSGEREDLIRQDAWGFLFLITVFFLLLASFLYTTVGWWVPLTVPGFNNAGQILTIELARVQLISMVFLAINVVQWASYHARQQFLWAEFAGVLANAFAFLLLVWALPQFGVIAAAWVAMIRAVMQTLLLAPGMGRPVRPNLSSVAIRLGWQRVKPLLMGAAYYKTGPLVDRVLLSTAGGGSLSLYYMAQQVYGAGLQVLNKTLSVPLVPILTKFHKNGDREGFVFAYHKKLKQVGVICLLGLLFLMLFGQAMLDLLVGYGNVSSENVRELWWIMVWLGGVFVGGAMGQVCSSSFYSCGDTVTPTRMSVLSYTVYIPSKIAAFYFWGIVGLAIATSVYYLVNLSLLIYLFGKKHVYEPI
ncbi:MAG: virulence factor MviN [Gammaproteobacteria bacterium]|nr:virulence factor MviN [Gammaproteobacteria bacterium]